MRVCVLGAGALGSALGAMLHRGGLDVVLVHRRAEIVDHLNAEGLLLRGAGADELVRVPAALVGEDLGRFDAVVVLVKSTNTRAAMESLVGSIGPSTVVLTLQNGLGNEETLGEVVGAQRVVAGRTYAGAVTLGPGVVLAGLAGRRTIIGELDGRRSDRLVRLAQAFTAAGVQTEVSERIHSVMWDKLLTNVATGAVSALTGLAYGALYAAPALQATACAAVAEAMSVAAAAGIELGSSDPEEVWRGAAEGLPAGFKTSMLQSVEARSVTEVDVVNGAVSRWGRRVGVATPVNDTLTALVGALPRAEVGAPAGGRSAMDRPVVPRAPEIYFEDAQVGDGCVTPAFTVTAEVIDAYARVSGDHNRVHVDEDFAQASHFGRRVAHGLFGLALVDGLKSQSELRFHSGYSLGWTVDFVKPIGIGDTLRGRFWVASKRESRSRPEWGIVVLPSELLNQDDEVVQRSEHRLMVPRRPAAPVRHTDQKGA
ncbi:MAG TPA: 2-dehydropantoate 2-reductase [Candidatus Lustribacter sp.]|nr:2-dehydropantoate 2-reductase [Candidatus Lustribacter sp.]